MVAKVADEVERIRDLEFRNPVAPEAVKAEEIAELLEGSLNHSFPREMMDRRSQAWETIGAVPEGTDLHQAVKDFAGTQIIGFYDTLSHRLVFIGSDNPTPYQRMTLAHELTHALDDQHFDLSQLDELENACQDERLQAFIALAEGDAVNTQYQWASTYLTPEEQAQLQEEASSFDPPPATVPPFLVNLLIFPYPNGQAFVSSLLQEGGQDAVDEAFRDPPVSTEQILHPSRYPEDEPQAVDVPDLTPALGDGWEAIDTLEVGEGWLRLLMELRTSSLEASGAAAGWDGGRYMAWGNGDRTIVVLDTVWDNDRDASEFADEMAEWTRGRHVRVEVRDEHVRVLFASDEQSLNEGTAAAGTL